MAKRGRKRKSLLGGIVSGTVKTGFSILGSKPRPLIGGRKKGKHW